MSTTEKPKPKQNQKSRRRNVRQRRSYKPRKPQEKIESSNIIRISESGARLLEMITNPFGNQAGGPVAVSYPYPDGNTDTIALAVTATASFSGATKTYGVFAVNPLETNAHRIGSVAYGASDSAAADNSSGTYYEATNYTIAEALAATQTKSVRYVAAGIKVKCTSSASESAGMLYPTWTQYVLHTGAANRKMGDLGMENVSYSDSYTVHQGCTTRMLFNNENSLWTTLPTSHTNSGANDVIFPAIYFSGLNSDTTLSISIVLHLEIRPARSALTFATFPVPPCPDLNEIIALSNDRLKFPSSSEGNSFKSFFQKVGTVIQKGAKFGLDNAPTLMRVLKYLA
jgi:predicted RecA/RadA family phage recombinase